MKDKVLGKWMKNQRGSSMVEAVIIYPIVIFILLALALFILFYYSKVVLLARENQILESGSSPVRSANADIWSLYGAPVAATGTENRARSVMDDLQAEASVKRGFFSNSLLLSAGKYEKSGVAYVDKALGDEAKGYFISYDAKSYIHEPAELIRNVNLVSDLVFLIPGAEEFAKKYSAALDSVSSSLQITKGSQESESE